MGNSKNKKRQPETYRNFLRYSGLGIQLFLTIGLCTWLGFWLDKKLDTLPLFMILLVISSLTGNIYLLVKSTNGDEGN